MTGDPPALAASGQEAPLALERIVRHCLEKQARERFQSARELAFDLKALLVEREDCDAGTVQQLRNALAQGGTQYRSLREVTELLKKKLESAKMKLAKEDSERK